MSPLLIREIKLAMRSPSGFGTFGVVVGTEATVSSAIWVSGVRRVVARTGFEPVISALRGRCPWPLDECATHNRGVGQLAGDRGFEPRLTEPESVVLPLDESPTLTEF